MKALIFVVALLLPFSALADRDFANGGYWTVTSVDTKPGMYDAYISDLNQYWRKSMDALVKDGKILSYQIFSNVNQRSGEPNLWLVTQWKSGAEMLDTSDEYWDAQTEELFGSIKGGTEANVKRGDLRTIMSTVLMREVSFKD